MKRITLKGGPRDGRSFDVPRDAVVLYVNGGRYVVKEDTGKWHANAAAKGATPSADIVDEIATCQQHRLVQHRDNKPKWCNTCGEDADGKVIGEPKGASTEKSAS